uniref:NADH dehydrogenase subunit 2 n=1 Tax=Chauliops quaternaria TaxID=2936723 RepID=UPI0030DF5CE9
MFNYSKMMFLIMIIMSTLLTISSTNWMGMWMGMEMNLMAFIPFISKNKNLKSSRAMMMYFIAQSIGSIMFLFAILMNSFIMAPIMMNEYIKTAMMIGLLIKLGMAPFHSWIPEMMSNINWNEMMIMMTWQKLAPMFTMSNFINNWALYLSIIMSAIVGAIGGLNTTSIQKILAYSSISHMSWMTAMMISQTQWLMYLMIYSIITMMLCWLMSIYNSYFINQISMMNEQMIEKITYTTLMLSMGGMPPFLGFLPKWMAIQSMINTKMMFMMTIMILMSLLTLFYYMRMISSLMLMYSTTNKWMKQTTCNTMIVSLMLSINLCLPVYSIMSFL